MVTTRIATLHNPQNEAALRDDEVSAVTLAKKDVGKARLCHVAAYRDGKAQHINILIHEAAMKCH